MLQENRDLTGKRNNAKMVIGYDLGRQFSQVSYYAVGDADPMHGFLRWQALSSITFLLCYVNELQ